MGFEDIAKKVNAENIVDSEKPPEPEPMKAVLDNSDTIERLEQTRKMLIEEKTRASSDELGKNMKSTAKPEAKPKSYSEQGYQAGYGGYGSTKTGSYYSSTTTTKEEAERAKAKKFANKCLDSSVDRISSEKSESYWNVVDSVNNKRDQKERTVKEQNRYNRKQRMKESFYRSVISVCTTVIESLYLNRDK